MMAEAVLNWLAVVVIIYCVCRALLALLLWHWTGR